MSGHTRLVHIGAALRERRSEVAIQRLALMAEGWAGGTRIGESLATFNRSYAASVLNRRSVVIIVFDGYDTGPPERLAAQLAALRRRCRTSICSPPRTTSRAWQRSSATSRVCEAKTSAPAQAMVAVLLAAGRSTRIGGCNKLLLEVGGQPMVRRAAVR